MSTSCFAFHSVIEEEISKILVQREKKIGGGNIKLIIKHVNELLNLVVTKV